MMKFPVALTDATTRLADVISTIMASPEWSLNSRNLSTLGFDEMRDLFQGFFDAYEGGPGEDWLGIMEWATIEEMRLRGPAFNADPAIVSAIASRMENNPNVRLER
jgi:hypothetical protein